MTDPIADYLTRLRNAISAKHRVVEVPASNLKKEITKILFDKGYILNYKFVEDGPQGTIKVALKYDAVNKVNAIKKLERVSTPGMRKYTGYKDGKPFKTRDGGVMRLEYLVSEIDNEMLKKITENQKSKENLGISEEVKHVK